MCSMAISLNQSSLPQLPASIHRNDYDRKNLKAGIVHFGVGAFHRSHQAFYLDRVLGNSNNMEWGLVGVGLLSFDLPMRDAMKAQDCLYTVHEMNPAGQCDVHLVQAMTEYIYAPDNWEAVTERLTDPNIKIVSLTITEGGYLMDTAGHFMHTHPTVVQDLANPTSPRSAFGYIIEALDRRRKAGINAFTVMSCDNLRHNGDQAKKACLAFATLRDPELALWIEENVTFPNGMVDRITPAMNPTLKAQLNEKSGVEDLAPVIAEDFIQWVLEDNFKYGRPAYEVAGVTMTPNVEPYEEAKIRLLNGSHQMLSYAAFLSGERKVDDALSNPLFAGYLRGFLFEDAAPWIAPIPGLDKEAYMEKLLQRFGNKAIGDQLARLCLDGGSKIPGFLLPTLKANLESKGTCHRMAYLLACYNHYIHSKKDDNGASFELKEPNAMSLLEPIIASESPLSLIEESQLVGDALAHPQFVKDYLTCFQNIQKHGARRTLEDLSSILSVVA